MKASGLARCLRFFFTGKSFYFFFVSSLGVGNYAVARQPKNSARTESVCSRLNLPNIQRIKTSEELRFPYFFIFSLRVEVFNSFSVSSLGVGTNKFFRPIDFGITK